MSVAELAWLTWHGNYMSYPPIVMAIHLNINSCVDHYMCIECVVYNLKLDFLQPRKLTSNKIFPFHF